LSWLLWEKETSDAQRGAREIEASPEEGGEREAKGEQCEKAVIANADEW
jgi:hypothetical protein